VTVVQYTFTHKKYVEQRNRHKQYIEQHSSLIRKSADRAPYLRGTPWHLPYKPYSFMTNGTRRGDGSALRSGRYLLPGKSRYSLYRRLVWPQGRSGQLRRISPPPGFDPRTVQPVATRPTTMQTKVSIT